MDAVTTGQRACLTPARAAARSTRCITLPPRTFPSVLASLGSANSEYSEIDSRTKRPGTVEFTARTCGGSFLRTRLADGEGFRPSLRRKALRRAWNTRRSHVLEASSLFQR